MKKQTSHGTSAQMLAAFENKVNELGSDVHYDVESTTSINASTLYGLADVKKYLKGKLKFYGNEIEMDFGDGLKLAKYLKGRGNRVNYCPSQETWSIPGECHWGDCYFYPYPADLDKCEDDQPWDSQSFPIESDTNIAGSRSGNRQIAHGTSAQMVAAFESKITQLGGDVESATDVNMEDDVEDIQDVEDAVTAAYRNDIIDDGVADIEQEYISSSASNKEEPIFPGDDKVFYRDNGGGFGGDGSEVYSLKEIKEIWNTIYDDDPILEEYSDFDSWWYDTKQFMTQVSDNETIESASDINTDDDAERYIETLIQDVDAALNELDLSDYIVERGDSESGEAIHVVVTIDNTVREFSVPEADLQWTFDAIDEDVTYITSEVSEYIGEVDEAEPEGSFVEIASKQVEDSDGFMTDYTMYRDTETGEYVFVFGDKDIYTPEQGDFDWSCDSEQEAWDWFNDYQGFGESDDEYYDDEYDDEDGEM